MDSTNQQKHLGRILVPNQNLMLNFLVKRDSPPPVKKTRKKHSIYQRVLLMKSGGEVKVENAWGIRT